MRLGVIGYQKRTGIGIMVDDFAEKLGAVAQLVIPHDTAEDLKLSTDRKLIHSNTWNPPRDVIDAFSELVDVAMTVESDWGGDVFPRLQENGVRVVLLPMFEWWNPALPMNENIDLYICTTKQCYEGVPFDHKVFIPCPVDTKKIKFTHRTGKPKLFVHNAGNLGIGGRKGTLETVRAFTHTKNQDIRLQVNSQMPPSNEVKWIINLDTRIYLNVENFENYEDLYKEGDVFIYTPHYDGQSMVTGEAMAAGLPVISVDAAPMNEPWKIYGDIHWLNNHMNLLVPVGHTENAQTINPRSLKNYVDEKSLAQKIDTVAELDVAAISNGNYAIAKKSFSWDVCLPQYKDALDL